MITFVITKGEEKISLNVSVKENIMSLKNKIIEILELKVKYIDLDVKIDRPIRVFGKFNLEPGLLSRSFDNYTLDRWGIDKQTINIDYTEVEGYDPTIKKTFVKKNNNKKYKCPGIVNIESGESYTQVADYNLESNDDFPSL